MSLNKITSRKFLIRDLKRNISLGGNKCFEFNGNEFYRDGNSSYKILDSDGDDIGTYDIDEIDDRFLKTRIRKKKSLPSVKQTIKPKARKKKRYDIIQNEFMVFVKNEHCIVDGCGSETSEAHHIYGRQPMRHDLLCVPLCAEHHRGSNFSVHEGEVKAFRQKYTKNLMEKEAIRIAYRWIKSLSSTDIPTERVKLLTGILDFVSAYADDNYNKAIKEYFITNGTD